MNKIRTVFLFLAVMAAGFFPGLIPSAQAAEIQILGNNLEIADGDATPRTEDFTFMGVQTLGAGSISKTFTIRNTSAAAGDNLFLTGTPFVVIGGANAADFVVTTQPGNALFWFDPSNSTTFVVTWTPAAGGIRDATLSIANNDSNENPYNFAIQATATLTLNYAAGPNGTLTGDLQQGGFEPRTAVTAVPKIGYHFVNWSDGSTANPRTDLNVTQNVNVTASFAIGGYTLAYTADADVTPGGTRPQGTLIGTTPQTVNHGASGTAVTAVPATGYSFSGWNDGRTDNPRTDLNVMRNVNATALFSINEYTLTYTAGPNGKLRDPRTGNRYGFFRESLDYGRYSSTILAEPDSGYYFVNWSDGETSFRRGDDRVTADVTATANFALDHPVTYTAGVGGSLTDVSSSRPGYEASTWRATAVPASGFRFVNWSDGRTDNPRTDSNVPASLSVTANFSANQPTVAGILPASGPTAGGTSVTISGANLTAAFIVTFGGTPATINSTTDASLTVTTPAHASGAVDVVITTTGGSSAPVTYTYNAPLTALETWRQTWYGATAGNSGNAANTADPYRTGVPNLLVFAFFGPTQNPATVRISQLPQVASAAGFLTYQFTTPAGVSGITYRAQWSASLGNDWQPVTDTGTPPGHLFSIPIGGAKKFLRLSVEPSP